MKSFITSLVLEIAAALDEAKFLFKLNGILLFINKSYFKLKRFWHLRTTSSPVRRHGRKMFSFQQAQSHYQGMYSPVSLPDLPG